MMNEAKMLGRIATEARKAGREARYAARIGDVEAARDYAEYAATLTGAVSDEVVRSTIDWLIREGEISA